MERRDPGKSQNSWWDWATVSFCMSTAFPVSKEFSPTAAILRERLSPLFHGGEPSANAGYLRDAGSIPGLGRSPGEGYGNPRQYFCLENPIDRGAWQATVHGVAKSWTQLKQFSTHAQRKIIIILKVDTLIKNSMALAYRQTYRSMEHNREL